MVPVWQVWWGLEAPHEAWANGRRVIFAFKSLKALPSLLQVVGIVIKHTLSVFGVSAQHALAELVKVCLPSLMVGLCL